jgi:hypothetical protein
VPLSRFRIAEDSVLQAVQYRTENVSPIIACCLFDGETTCPHSCYLVTAVELSPVYRAVTWQWAYMSSNFRFVIVKGNVYIYIFSRSRGRFISGPT